MKANPVGWFEIYVNDLTRARAFYEAVFQTTLSELPVPDPNVEMWAFPYNDTDLGAAGALVRIDGCPAGGNSVLVYFSCEDCAVEESRVAPNGGKVCKPRFSVGKWGFISLVMDTEGNMIGLHSRS